MDANTKAGSWAYNLKVTEQWSNSYSITKDSYPHKTLAIIL